MIIKMNDEEFLRKDYRNFYSRNPNEIEIHHQMSNANNISPLSYSPSTNSNSSTFSKHSNSIIIASSNKNKTTDMGEISVINTGVVKNLLQIFNKSSSSSSTNNSYRSTSNNYQHNNNNNSFNKKEGIKQFELKKCQSVYFENIMSNRNDLSSLNSAANQFQNNRAKSNNCLNDIMTSSYDSRTEESNIFENVNIKARISQFTRKNSINSKDPKYITRKKSFNKNTRLTRNDIDEYKGSLNYLDKIGKQNGPEIVEELLCESTNNLQNSDDTSENTTFNDDFSASLDNSSSTNSNKESNSNKSSHIKSSDSFKLSNIDSSSFNIDRIRFEEKYNRILQLFVCFFLLI